MTLPKPYWRSPDGSHVLFCGDAIDILPLLETGSVDCLLADPPFAIENQFGSAKFEVNDGGKGGTRIMQFGWDDKETSANIARAFTLAIKTLKPSASAFCFCGFDSARAYSDPFREAGFTVKPAAWVKPYPPPPGKGNWWPSAFELAFYGYRKSPWFGDDGPTRSNVFVSDTYRHGQPGKVDHPTGFAFF